MEQAEISEDEIKKVMGIDCYLQWVEREGLPITEDFAIDMFAVETVPWPRVEANGAVVHTSGGDVNASGTVVVQPSGQCTGTACSYSLTASATSSIRRSRVA